MAKILVVEDDVDLGMSLKDFLMMDHHLVDLAHTGKAAQENLGYSAYDLLILDWSLPDTTGLEICKQFRTTGGACAVLMLTGRDETASKIRGLDAGADDYLTKPFHPDELLSRIRALLRRPGAFQGNELKIGGLVLEPSTFRLTRDAEEIRLLPKEFALLQFLMRHPNEVFSTEALIERVWESGTEVSPEVVRSYINRLRNKIDRKGETSMLRTLHGIGYKLEAS